MKRYISLYKKFFVVNLSLFFAYRTNVINNFIAASVWSALMLGTMFIITKKATLVAGWTQAEMLLIAGALLICLGLFEIHFKRSFQQLPDTILMGDLDNLLLKPVDSQFLISFAKMHITAFYRVAIGICFTLYVVSTFSMQITFPSFILFLFLCLFGASIYYSLWLMGSTLLIWFPRLSNILEFLNSFNHTSRFPPDMYREFNTYIFFFLLPFMFLVATPVKALLQEATFADFLGLIISSFGLLLLSRWFWKRSLRYYTSASG